MRLIGATSAILAIPSPPVEVWMFWCGDDWLRAADDVRGADVYLVALSASDAKATVEDQAEKWGVTCISVRVK